MKKFLGILALVCMLAAPAVAYDVEQDVIDFTGQTVTSGSYLASDRFTVNDDVTPASIEGGDFYGRWMIYGDMDISGGSINAVEVTKYEPDGTPYQAVQGGLYFRGDNTAETTITGGDFTGLAYTELGGGSKYFWNGEGDGEHTVHIRGGSWANNQLMYSMNNATTYIYGTDFTIDIVELPAVGIPVFPSYLPASMKLSAAIITCTLEDGSAFTSEWRFWEADAYGDEKYFNFGTVFEVEWRYEERYDKDIPEFDGWGWWPVLDGSGNYTPYFASGDSYDGPDDNHWQGPLVLVDVSQQQEPIPEPATTALLGLGVLGGIVGARRRRK